MTTLAIVNPAETVDYSSTNTPSSYVCGECRKSGVKLWRLSGPFLAGQSLRCADCSAKEQGQDITDIDPRTGKYSTDHSYSDQIHDRMPAVPTEENTTFWSYTMIPYAGVDWWLRLPLR